MSIKRRIEVLESEALIKPLVVLYIDRNGNECKGSVEDMEKNGADFIRILSGSDLHEAERVLKFVTPAGCVIQ